MAGTFIANLASARERIAARSELDPQTGCINWMLSKNKSGYGMFSINGKMMNASRAAYIAFVGPVPPGMCVCHTCDNPACVNPQHLWAGSYKENWDDCRKKGREAKGTKNGRSKLTDADVVLIREAASEGEIQCSIGSRFGVTHGAVSKIVNRKMWIHVPHRQIADDPQQMEGTS